MQYKTLILELLEQQTSLHARLRANRTLLMAMNALTQELKRRHEAWYRSLRADGPEVDPGQLSSMALEFALQEIELLLQSAYPGTDDDLTGSDPVLAFMRNLTLSD